MCVTERTNKQKKVSCKSVSTQCWIYRGTRTHSSKLFRPNCPSEPRPHEKICPLSFRATVWASPHDTATMVCASRATTCSNRWQREMFKGWVTLPGVIITTTTNKYYQPGFFLDFSWPSCPRSLQPQVYTVPSSSRKAVCLWPHPTSHTFFPWKNSHFRASTTISSSIPPKPNCP